MQLRKSKYFQEKAFEIYTSFRKQCFQMSFSPYSVQMRKNADQKNSKDGDFSRSDLFQ